MSRTIPLTRGSAGLFGNENRRKITWMLFLLPALLVYLVFMAGPLLDSMRLSLYQGEGYTPTTFVGFQNYIDLFTNELWRGKFLGAVLHTSIFLRSTWLYKTASVCCLPIFWHPISKAEIFSEPLFLHLPHCPFWWWDFYGL